MALAEFRRRIGEAYIDWQVDHHQPHYDRKEVLDHWVSIRRSNNIPGDAIRLTEERIERAFDQYDHGLAIVEARREAAFFIQPRGSYKSPDASYGDISDYLPALDSRYGVSPHQRHTLFYALPPFEVAEYLYDFSGRSGVGAVVCVPLSVDAMEEALHEGGRKGVGLYAQPRIYDAVKFARGKLGARNIGLGETMASMTQYGKHIERKIADVQVTTGHAGTTWLIDNTIQKARELGGIDLANEMVGIIGCGSIGTAAAMHLDGRVGGFVLSDINRKSAERLKSQLEESYPGIRVWVAGSNEDLCRKSKFIVGAGSNLAPILRSQHIREGTVIIDDSQPVTARREEVEAAGGLIIWPIAQMPECLERVGYNYGPQGVIPKTGWGCETELWALHLTGNMNGGRVNHRVDNDDIERIADLATQVGFRLSEPLQSFGMPIAGEQWEKIRESRRS